MTYPRVMRILSARFWLIVAIAFLSRSVSAQSPALRLWLKDGGYVDGQILPAPSAGHVGWKSAPFDQPLEFDVRAVRGVGGVADDQPTDVGGHTFLTASGTRIRGQLVEWTEDSVVLTSESLGTVHLDPSLLRSVESAADSGHKIYSGPRSSDDWQSLGKPNDWEFAAGSLSTAVAEASVLGDVRLPKQFQLALRMSWQGNSYFVLSLGCSKPKPPQPKAKVRARRAEVQVDPEPAAVRLEMWDGQLAVIREIADSADIAILPVDDADSQLDLTLYIDQVAGLIAVYTPRGRLLEQIQVADAKGHARGFALLENHGKQVTLNRFDVFSWDGHVPDSKEYPESYVLDKSEKLHEGYVRSYDADTNTLTVAVGEEELSMDLASLRRTVIAAGDVAKRLHRSVDEPADGNAAAQADTDSSEKVSVASDTVDEATRIEFDLADTSRLIGTLHESVDGKFTFHADGIDRPLHIDPKNVVGMNGSTVRFVGEAPAGEVGTLTTDAAKLQGALSENVEPDGDAVLVWHPWASRTEAAISRHTSGAISYPTKRARSKPVAEKPRSGFQSLIGGLFGQSGDPKTVAPNVSTDPQRLEMDFRSGDTVDGVVVSIDSQGVTFRSDDTSATFMGHADMASVSLQPMSSSSDMDEKKMARLMTVPRAMKDDPPTHLLLSPTGDYLRGRLVALDAKSATIEVRLEPRQIPRSNIARIIWLQDRDWTAEEEAAESEPSDAEQADAADDDDVFLVHAVRDDQRGVTFAPKQLSEGRLGGISPLLGECSVRLSDTRMLLFGTDVARKSREMRQESWTLSLATLPKVYQQGADEGFAPDVQSPLVGRPAPAIELNELEGKAFRLKDHRGKIVVLDFWASWCGPCIQAMPEIDRIVGEFTPGQVELIAVNIQDSATRARLAVERMGLSATVIMDVDGEAAQYYDARAIPQTVIIDREGTVQHVFVGGGKKMLEQFSTALREAVDGGAP